MISAEIYTKVEQIPAQTPADSESSSTFIALLSQPPFALVESSQVTALYSTVAAAVLLHTFLCRRQSAL